MVPNKIRVIIKFKFKLKSKIIRNKKINDVARKLNLSIDEIQERLGKLMVLVPGIETLYPKMTFSMFFGIIKDNQDSINTLTMLKRELRNVNLSQVVLTFPNILRWGDFDLRDVLCRLVNNLL